MTQPTLTKNIFFMSDGFGIEPQVYAGSGGSKVFKGVAVFRSGTFRDSMGYTNTWEDLHIKQMMDNYDHLRNKNILQSVPVRDGHPGFLINNIPGKGEVVGWHQNVTTKVMKSPVDSEEYTYLLADYEITQAYALEKINNGTWRNRSAEIGDHVTNNEAEFWPVYRGFAFVDFSAVEGLNFSSSQGKFYAYFGGTSRETQVTQPAQQGTPAVQLPPVLVPPVPTQHAAPQAPVQPAQPFVFSMGGQNVTDPNAVQAYIRNLETFAAETREAGRKAFVASLVSSNKLMAPQQDGMEKFALSLSDEQFGTWKATWDNTLAQPVLQNHAAGSAHSTEGGSGGNASPQEQAIKDAESVVRMHEQGGQMSPEQIKATKSYQALVAAGKRPA